jgi:hypothetical protein
MSFGLTLLYPHSSLFVHSSRLCGSTIDLVAAGVTAEEEEEEGRADEATKKICWDWIQGMRLGGIELYVLEYECRSGSATG